MAYAIQGVPAGMKAMIKMLLKLAVSMGYTALALEGLTVAKESGRYA